MPRRRPLHGGALSGALQRERGPSGRASAPGPPAQAVEALRAAPRLVLTATGRWLVAAGLVWVATGLIASNPPVTAIGAVPLVVLAWAYAAARAVRSAVREDAITVNLHVDEGELRVNLGRAIEVPLSVAVHLKPAPSSLVLEPRAAAPLEASLSPDQSRLRLRPSRVGDAWFQGFVARIDVAGGLFAVRAWLAAPQRLSVLPRRFMLKTDTALRATRSSLQEQAGLTYTRRRGHGLEIRELRDHQPGDPFKHIAWRASARRGKLISREYESDLVLSTWVVIDVSPSMFWGKPGKARIDYAIETAYNLLEVVLGQGDRAGLLIHDDQVRVQVPPGTGRPQLIRLLDALTEIPHLVHESRTELTDGELVERAASWLRAQSGKNFKLPERLMATMDPRESGYDEVRLVGEAARVLHEALESRPRKRPIVPIEAYARDPARATLRAFCRHVGIPLPLDPTPRPGAQAEGIETAIHSILRHRGGPHAIVLISDLYTADDLEALRRVALASRRHRHSMVVFCPSDPAFDNEDLAALDRLQLAVAEVSRLRVRQALDQAQAALKGAGVTFLRCGPEDVVPRLLQRLRHAA